MFNGLEYPDEIRLKLVPFQLKDRAQIWWETTTETLSDSGEKITWEVFRTQFAQEYAPPSYYSAKEDEFNLLVQGNKSVADYASQFSALLPYVPHVAKNDRSKLSNFLKGLTRTIHTLVTTGTPSTYMKAVEKAKKIEASLLRGEPQSIPASVSQGAGSSSQTPMGLPSYQPIQSSQQVKRPWFKAKGKPFKKKPQSSSFSSSGSRGGSSVGSSGRVYCDRCGGNHLSAHCTGFPGTCYTCGQAGHSSRVCPNAGRQPFQPQQFGQFPRRPSLRPYTPVPQFAPTQPYVPEEKLKVSDIPVVKDFPDVFPDEIPGFPPQREIDLSIELMPGTSPIFRVPYRLAPAELKELKTQLQDLLEKGVSTIKAIMQKK
ncbi:uncharacterized protein [Henckelia pumila]|uniref:uncharacterized protein n=1 Tax=Henckelia pumila TaxID=405737 RepID=UPI003C6E528E